MAMTFADNKPGPVSGCPLRLILYPADECLDLGTLAVREGRQVITRLAAHRHVREGHHQRSARQRLACQLPAPHGDTGVVGGGKDRQIRSIKSHV